MVGSLHLVGISILCMQCCRYLTEEIFKKPVIVYNYPKEIKAFYMRLNDDKKTVAAMDVLVPKVPKPLSHQSYANISVHIS